MLTVGTYVILSTINKGAIRSYPFFFSLGLLFVVLFFNMSIMMGAIKVKSVANSSLTIIEQLHNVINPNNMNDLGRSITNGDYMDVIQQLGHASDNLDINNIQELKNQLVNNWSLLKLYFSSYGMSPTMLVISPTKTIERFNSKMNTIILSNVLWSLSFLVFTIIVAMYKMKKPEKASTSRPKYSSHRNTRYDDDF